MPRRVALTAPLVAALLLGTGCSRGSDDDRPAPPDPPKSAPTPAPTDPTTTLTPEAQDEAEVRDLMEGWFARGIAIYEGRADVAELADYLTGTFLDQIEQRVADVVSSGETFDATTRARRVVESIEVDGPTAEVATCVYESGTYRAADGEATDEVDSTFRFVTTAVRTDDGWRLSDQHQVGAAEDGDRCG